MTGSIEKQSTFIMVEFWEKMHFCIFLVKQGLIVLEARIIEFTYSSMLQNYIAKILMKGRYGSNQKNPKDTGKAMLSSNINLAESFSTVLNSLPQKNINTKPIPIQRIARSSQLAQRITQSRQEEKYSSRDMGCTESLQMSLSNLIDANRNLKKVTGNSQQILAISDFEEKVKAVQKNKSYRPKDMMKDSDLINLKLQGAQCKIKSKVSSQIYQIVTSTKITSRRKINTQPKKKKKSAQQILSKFKISESIQDKQTIEPQLFSKSSPISTYKRIKSAKNKSNNKNRENYNVNVINFIGHDQMASSNQKILSPSLTYFQFCIRNLNKIRLQQEKRQQKIQQNLMQSLQDSQKFNDFQPISKEQDSKIFSSKLKELQKKLQDLQNKNQMQKSEEKFIEKTPDKLKPQSRINIRKELQKAYTFRRSRKNTESLKKEPEKPDQFKVAGWETNEYDKK